MFSHVTFGISDFERAMRFYAPVMARLGLTLRFAEAAVPWAAWQMPAAGRPLFIIMRPHDGVAASVGNGTMAAFMAPDRDTVRECHAIGLRQGGADEGAPGLRPQYHQDYFGGYLRDPDGNKLCIVCHSAQGD